MQKQIDRLEEYIRAISSYSEPLSDQIQLREELGVDSLRMVEMIVFLEECYGIELFDEDLNMTKFNTVGDLRKMIEGYLK